MEETIEVACECPKSDMARFLGRLKKMRMIEGDRTAADYADDEPNVFHNLRYRMQRVR
jgi:translation initiation factor IF-1